MTTSINSQTRYWFSSLLPALARSQQAYTSSHPLIISILIIRSLPKQPNILHSANLISNENAFCIPNLKPLTMPKFIVKKKKIRRGKNKRLSLWFCFYSSVPISIFSFLCSISVSGLKAKHKTENLVVEGPWGHGMLFQTLTSTTEVVIYTEQGTRRLIAFHTLCLCLSG